MLGLWSATSGESRSLHVDFERGKMEHPRDTTDRCIYYHVLLNFYKNFWPDFLFCPTTGENILYLSFLLTSTLTQLKTIYCKKYILNIECHSCIRVHAPAVLCDERYQWDEKVHEVSQRRCKVSLIWCKIYFSDFSPGAAPWKEMRKRLID